MITVMGCQCALQACFAVFSPGLAMLLSAAIMSQQLQLIATLDRRSFPSASNVLSQLLDVQVILDVVFNHTAEGNQKGPTLSFRGLDNRVYYMLAPLGEYYNYSGCGNTFNCNHPTVRKFIVDCLKYWVTEFHVDGFRFDLASIMTRAHSAWHPSS